MEVDEGEMGEADLDVMSEDASDERLDDEGDEGSAADRTAARKPINRQKKVSSKMPLRNQRRMKSNPKII